MKAAIYKGKQKFVIDEVSTPVPGPTQVLIKVKFSAICGTDVHRWLYDTASPGKIFGHEFSGVVCSVGSEVKRLKEGDRVIGGGGQPPIGKAKPSSVDPRFNFRFHSDLLGAFAEYVILEDWQPLIIPNGVSDEAAALCEPCSIAVRGVRQSDMKIGDTVAVIGAGPIGMFTLQAALAAGAASVIVSDPVEVRRNASLKMGASHVIDPTTEDIVSTMVELSGGIGPDVVFDCAGWGSTLDESLTMVRREGQVVLIALSWEPILVQPVDWVGREVKMKAAYGSRPEDWSTAVNLIRDGRIQTDPMIDESDFVDLDDIQQAFENLVSPSTQLQMIVRID